MYGSAYAPKPSTPEINFARLRLTRVLTRYAVASIRTLESKISESGRGSKPAPHILYYALQTMINDGTVTRESYPGLDTQLYALAAVDSTMLASRLAYIGTEYLKWKAFATANVVGRHLESVIKRLFATGSTYYVAPCWGNVVDVNAVPIPSSGTGPYGSVDGLVFLTAIAPEESATVLELKNKRDWLYPSDRDLWDIIRNGYVVNAVPVIMTRKIYHSTFSYVLGRVGAIGIQLHNQFLPPSLQTDLASCRLKDSLGFKDLLFTDFAPQHLQEALSILATQIPVARKQMAKVRKTVEPFLADLASKVTVKAAHQQRYSDLQGALDAL